MQRTDRGNIAADRLFESASLVASARMPMDRAELQTQPGPLMRKTLAVGYATARYTSKEQSTMSFTPDTDCHVLIVEDDESIMSMIQMLLELREYTAATAANGAAAIQYLTETSTPPRVILLDLQMPGMDGRAFLAMQRTNPAWSAIPVVLMTASNDAMALQQQLDIQASIQKPFDPTQLLDLVDRFCS
jgi:CheY-like chemotaxis protein